MTSTLSSKLTRLQTIGLISGAVGIVVAIIMAFVSGGDSFFQSYLYAFLFWMGLALGCFILLMVQHMAGGSWGAMIRRPLEAGASVLPVMAIMFIPILFGMGFLYDDWIHPHNALVEAKVAYLNKPGWIIRSLIYFSVWSFGAWYFVSRSKKQDEVSEEQGGKIGFGLKRSATFWIVIHILLMTFAAVDWAMSTTPEFFSGMYSVILMIGQAISAMCLIIFTMVFLANNDEEIDELLNSKRLQDLGNFLMAFTLFWAYTSFSQLIIIWSNNIIETNPYYVLRFNAAWQGVGYFLLLFGFFAPFAILFSRWVKRKRRALVAVAIWAVLVRLIDLFYILIPNFEREGFPLQISDVALMLGFGGIWIAVFAFMLKRNPLLPKNDPRLRHAPTGAHHG